MRGAKERVFALIPYKDDLDNNPVNKYVFDQSITKPWVNISPQVGHAEIVLSRRNIPVMLISRPQGVLTRLQNEEFTRTISGGIAILPNHPGSIWT